MVAAIEKQQTYRSGEEIQQELLAFSPTGDKLYDAYQQALLAALAQPPAPGARLSDAPQVPDALLAQWAPDFGSDPRYWQLRWFELNRAPEEDRQPALMAALDTQWLASGAVDATTLWLRYLQTDANLREAQVPYNEAEAERERLLGELTARYPEESEPHYEQALLAFKHGDWPTALARIEAGNAAPSNRNLMPFPISFVLARLQAGQSVGNESAAGIVLDQSYSFGYVFGRNIRIKDTEVEFEVRANLSGGLDEAASLHRFCCRLGSMDSGGTVGALISSVIGRMLASYLLTEQAESFSGDQRQELLYLFNAWGRISQDVKRLNVDEPRSNAFMQAALEQAGIGPDLLANYILEGEPAERAEQRIARAGGEQPEGSLSPPDAESLRGLLRSQPDSSLGLNLRALHFAYSTVYARYEYVTEMERLREDIARCASFDWAKVELWPAAQ